jgi:glycosyltransferase involved in cell wall biosynthesis
VQATSTRLRDKFEALGAPVRVVRNGCDPDSLPPVAELGALREPDLVGFVGTIAAWFDWPAVVALAQAHPGKRFVLVGPLMEAPRMRLPSNVELHPACAHGEAMRWMARFAAGLIPFRRNALTAAVDPVKYYEYRALGLPVLSSDFGEMPYHAQEDEGVFALGAPDALDRALSWPSSTTWIEAFRAANSWAARFAAAEA